MTIKDGDIVRVKVSLKNLPDFLFAQKENADPIEIAKYKKEGSFKNVVFVSDREEIEVSNLVDVFYYVDEVPESFFVKIEDTYTKYDLLKML